MRLSTKSALAGCAATLLGGCGGTINLEADGSVPDAGDARVVLPLDAALPELPDAGLPATQDAGAGIPPDANFGPVVVPDSGPVAGPDASLPALDAGSPSKPDAGAVLPDAGSPDAGLCDPVAQTGCADPKSKCGLLGGSFGCQVPGTIGNRQSCGLPDNTGDDCQAGYFCFQTSYSSGECVRFCEENSDCPPNETCALEQHWGLNTFLMCRPVDRDCSPLLQNCPDPNEACFPTAIGDLCSASWGVPDGQPCDYADDCLKGSACFNTSGIPTCRKICDPANPVCPTGTCHPQTNQTFGLCY